MWCCNILCKTHTNYKILKYVPAIAHSSCGKMLHISSYRYYDRCYCKIYLIHTHTKKLLWCTINACWRTVVMCTGNNAVGAAKYVTHACTWTHTCTYHKHKRCYDTEINVWWWLLAVIIVRVNSQAGMMWPNEQPTNSCMGQSVHPEKNAKCVY
jgi:hypothetical protein